MRVYFSFGGNNVSKALRMLDVARVFSGHFLCIFMMEILEIMAVPSMKQFGALFGYPRVFRHAPEESIVGGWSMGCKFAYCASVLFVTCFDEFRGLFLIDDRTTVPCGFYVPAGGFTKSRSDRVSSRRSRSQSLTMYFLKELPMLRPSTSSDHFPCFIETMLAGHV